MTVWRVWGELYVEGDDIVAAVRHAADAFDTVARQGEHDWGWTISSMTPINEQEPPVPARWVPPHLRLALKATQKSDPKKERVSGK